MYRRANESQDGSSYTWKQGQNYQNTSYTGNYEQQWSENRYQNPGLKRKAPYMQPAGNRGRASAPSMNPSYHQTKYSYQEDTYSTNDGNGGYEETEEYPQPSGARKETESSNPSTDMSAAMPSLSSSEAADSSATDATSQSLPPGFSPGLTDFQSGADYGADPVTRAVVDNILGKTPTKRPRVELKCDLCNLEFTSQIPLDMHLKGSKHAKKLRSQEIVQHLQKQGQVIKTQDLSSMLRCDICDVLVNSSQQLQLHLSGSKHKSRCLKLNVDPAQTMMKPLDQVPSVNADAQRNGNSSVPKLPESGESATAAPGSTVDAALKVGKFYCQTCEVALNSEIQLQQHMGSKKHQDRLEGKPVTKKLWWKNKKGVGWKKNSAEAENPQRTTGGMASLENTFVKGETME